jgi:hypothetical protein
MADQPPLTNADPSRAVLRVANGRGFVVEDFRGKRYVITTACTLLDTLFHEDPLNERAYKLLAELGSELSTWAEIVFNDMVADLAVLRSPDIHTSREQTSDYSALLEKYEPLAIADAPKDGDVRVMSSDGRWFDCRVERPGDSHAIWLSWTAEPVTSDMAGSPIVLLDGRAIGVVRDGVGTGVDEGWTMNPNLVQDLPLRLLSGFVVPKKRDKDPA